MLSIWEHLEGVNFSYVKTWGLKFYLFHNYLAELLVNSIAL